MRVYSCSSCLAALYPEVTACLCGRELVYDPRADALATFEEQTACGNRDRLGCSWIADAGTELCLSCGTTRVEPDLSAPDALGLWKKTEAAKRWTLAGLLRLGWFAEPDEPLPEFHILSEKIGGAPANVMMGHQAGLITLNIMEADPARAAARKQRFGEPLRTMVGHVRHELAHFLFDRLAREHAGFLEAVRALMGDERPDYGAAMQSYYQTGPLPDWQQSHISAYATAHPHEDWAETAAHVLHLADLADSAEAVGIQSDGAGMLERAQDVGMKLNHLCRSLGQPDPYPMIISPQVLEKLNFARQYLLRRAG